MTIVSSLNSASRLSNAPPQNVGLRSVASGKVTAQTPVLPQQSTIVTVGAENPASAAQTYSSSGMSANTALAPIWETQSNDDVSSLMAGNFQSQLLASRFKGLGSALLDMFKTGSGSRFSQSVMQLPPDQSSSITQTGSTPLADEKLVIKTKSGVEVDISLESQDGGLAVKMKSSGELSDDERAALAKLSGAFQDAIDGLSANQPRLDLGGLMQFDSTVLSSVDLHSDITPPGQATQSMAFHADSTARTLSFDGPVGTVKVNVDMHDSSSWGSQKQQADAIDSYLKQFDQASSRGKGEESLTAMFKDAFTQMNSNYGAPSLRPAASLAESDHAMLTGLADFKASVTQRPQASNPMRLSELDTFSYDVSQSTNVKGGSQLDRSISQQQQSHLKASYHMSFVPDVPLELSTLKSSQNYYYKQIDDAADSATDIGYNKGLLVRASLSQSASQSTELSKYEMGELVNHTKTPFNASLTRDILATLKPFLRSDKPMSPVDAYRWQETLSDVHKQILLQDDPATLRAQSILG
jgi:hypothetical protein